MCIRQHRIIWTKCNTKAAYPLDSGFFRIKREYPKILPFVLQVLFSFLIRCADQMAQRHQAVRQVHVFDRNAQSLQMKVLAGEIPQTADTALYQTACNTRSISSRNGEHRPIRLVALTKLRKRIRAAHLMTAKALTDELRICVERTQQLKAAGRKV